MGPLRGPPNRNHRVPKSPVISKVLLPSAVDWDRGLADIMIFYGFVWKY